MNAEGLYMNIGVLLPPLLMFLFYNLVLTIIYSLNSYPHFTDYVPGVF